MKVSIKMAIGLLIFTVAIGVSIFTGSFPLVPVIISLSATGSASGFFLLNYIFENYQHNILTGAQDKINEISKLKISLSNDTEFQDLKNKINRKFKDLGFSNSDISVESTSEEGVFAKINTNDVEAGKQSFLHINYRLIQEMFMEGTNFKKGILDNATLTMFIAHELRHKNNPSWSEWRVSFFDIFSFITALVKEFIGSIFGVTQTEEEQETLTKKEQEAYEKIKTDVESMHSKAINKIANRLDIEDKEIENKKGKKEVSIK